MSRGAVLVAVGFGDIVGGLMGFAPAGSFVEAVFLFGGAVACVWIGWFARGVA